VTVPSATARACGGKFGWDLGRFIGDQEGPAMIIRPKPWHARRVP
jgi:hypothetical protein